MQRIKVVARVRPLNAAERAGQGACVEQRASTLTVRTSSVSKNTVASHAFDFDAVLGEAATQEDMYALTAAPLIDRVFQGYNATIMAYGQTGSGKTYTMGAPGDDSGITARAVNDMFARRDRSMRVTLSYVEVYNEAVYDLLPRDGGGGGGGQTKVLSVRDDGVGGVVVQGVCEREVSSAAEVGLLLERGARSRRVGSTAMNDESSRSHALVTLAVASQGLAGKLTLVDLAGSERVSKTGAEGQRFNEGVQINKGLLALGNVVSALAENNNNNNNNNSNAEEAPSKQVKGGASAAPPRTHVAYRDSKLTRLLRDSLGGTATTVMIACVAAAAEHADETQNTLRYAQRARVIANDTAVRHRDDHVDPRDAEIAQLRAENARLNDDLLVARTTTTTTTPSESFPSCATAEARARADRAEAATLRLEEAVEAQRATANKATLQADRARLELESLKRRQRGPALLPHEEGSSSSQSDARFTEVDGGDLDLVAELRAEVEALKKERGPAREDEGSSLAPSPQEVAAAEALLAEERAMEGLREQFLVAVSSLEAELTGLERARDKAAADLDEAQKKQRPSGTTTTTGPNNSNLDQLREALRSRKAALDAKARELEGARKEARRLDALRAAAEQESDRLRTSAKVALAKRVDLEKKLRVEAVARAAERRAAELDRLRAARQSDKSKAQLHKLKSDHDRATAVLKRRVEHEAIKNKHKDRLFAAHKPPPQRPATAPHQASSDASSSSSSSSVPPALATKLELHVATSLSRQLAAPTTSTSSVVPPFTGCDPALALRWYHAELLKARLLAQRRRLHKSPVKAKVPSHTVAPAAYRVPLSVALPARRRGPVVEEDESSEWEDDCAEDNAEDEEEDEEEDAPRKGKGSFDGSRERTVAELKQELRAAGLKLGGRKSELVARLKAHRHQPPDRVVQAEAPPPPPKPTRTPLATLAHANT